MTNISDLNAYYDTQDADVLAADLHSGKVAYGANGKIVGTAAVATPFGPETMLHWDCTQYAGSAAFEPTIAEMYLGTGVSIQGKTAGDAFLANNNKGVSGDGTCEIRWQLPARPTGGARVWRCGLLMNLDPYDQYAQIQLRTNYVDGSNYWINRVMVDPTNTWRAQLLERSGSEIGRDGPDNFSASYFKNTDTYFEFVVTETANIIQFCVIGRYLNTETSANYTDIKTMEYYSASRAHASANIGGIVWAGGGEEDLTLKYINVTHIENF